MLQLSTLLIVAVAAAASASSVDPHRSSPTTPRLNGSPTPPHLGGSSSRILPRPATAGSQPPWHVAGGSPLQSRIPSPPGSLSPAPRGSLSPLQSSSPSPRGSPPMLPPRGSPPTSPRGSQSVQQAGRVPVSKEVATAQALAFLDKPSPEDPTAAKHLEELLNDAGLKCETKETCIALPINLSNERLLNLAKLYQHCVQNLGTYPPLYLRYYVPDQVVFRLVWSTTNPYNFWVNIHPPSTLSVSSYASTPGIMKTRSTGRLVANPLSWILRFHPIDTTRPGSSEGPLVQGSSHVDGFPYRTTSPPTVTPWVMNQLSDLVTIEPLDQSITKAFVYYIEPRKDFSFNRGLLAYLQLGPDFDYEGLHNMQRSMSFRESRGSFVQWLRDQAERNGGKFDKPR